MSPTSFSDISAADLIDEIRQLEQRRDYLRHQLAQPDSDPSLQLALFDVEVYLDIAESRLEIRHAEEAAELDSESTESGEGSDTTEEQVEDCADFERQVRPVLGRHQPDAALAAHGKRVVDDEDPPEKIEEPGGLLQRIYARDRRGVEAERDIANNESEGVIAYNQNRLNGPKDEDSIHNDSEDFLKKYQDYQADFGSVNFQESEPKHQQSDRFCDSANEAAQMFPFPQPLNNKRAFVACPRDLFSAYGSPNRPSHTPAYGFGGHHPHTIPIRSPIKMDGPIHGLDGNDDRKLPLPASISKYGPDAEQSSSNLSSTQSYASSPPDGSPMDQARKRLPSSPTHPDDRPSKQICMSTSPGVSDRGTPRSAGSSRSSSTTIPEFLTGFMSPGEVREQRREMRRLENERRDAEYAQQLQAQFNFNEANPSSSSSNPVGPIGMQYYQSYINQSGGLRREALGASSPLSSLPQVNFPHHVPQSNSNASRSSPQASTQTSSPFPILGPSPFPTLGTSPPSTTPWPGTDRAPIVNIEDGSDSDISIIPPYNYVQQPPQLNGSSSATQINSSQDAQAAGSSNWSLPSFYMGENFVYPSFTPMTNAISRVVGSLYSGLNPISGPHFDYGHWWPDTTSGNPTLDQGIVDPKETAKEIKDLMNNIRPDEDLGSDDRTGSPEDMADGCALYEHQKLGLAWMKQKEEGSNKGGILADDMGLGKTIQAIALMVTRRSESRERKTTLVVAPLALLRQWETEIKFKVKPERKLTVYKFHGTKKNIGFAELKKYDVVLTTYGTLAADYKRLEQMEQAKTANPDMAMTELTLIGKDSKWYRVILDEAQNIKNKSTKAFKAAACLQALSRFCMTGTPMMNNVAELHSLIAFLRIRPYSEWTRFRQDIELPLKESSARGNETAMRRLQALLKAVLLRRTKKSLINGEPIILLPERNEVTEWVEMEGDQAEFYSALEKRTQIRFNRYLRDGNIGQNYHSVLLLLLRLRQTCCHPHLIRNHPSDVAGTTDKSPEQLKEIAQNNLAANVVRRLIDEGQVDCPICMDAVENATIFTPCGHMTCSECFTKISDPTQAMDDGVDHRGGRFKCMNCRGLVDSTKVTDWVSFKKVHIEPEEKQKSSDTESVSGSETESEDETDSLDDFIEDDEAKVKEEAGESSKSAESAIEAEDGDEFKDPTDRKLWPIKSEKRKSNGKSKGKRKDTKIKLKNYTLSELQKAGGSNLNARRRYFKKLRENYVSSAKTDKCLEILEGIAAKPGNEKTIVFSQFTTFLDLIEIPLIERGRVYKRYDGSMSITARDEAVFEFSHRRSCKILLCSLKAGNAGLNLTAANNVIILDPFWNPYIEQQAIDRVHRIGQRLPVTCYRVLIRGTVEDRIMDIQESKRRIVDGALDENAAKGVARLSQSDLAYLFGVNG